MSGQGHPTPRHLPLEVEPGSPGGSTRLLVTNDDGLGSPGIRELARDLAADHEVVVAAPAQDVSGAGTSIGRIDATAPTELQRQDLGTGGPGDAAIEAYAIDGPPGLAVMTAALGAFGQRPDLVVSGVNAGLNTGSSIIHSGTVGAVLTGHTFGLSGVAFSLAPGDRWYWETALPVARAVVRWLAAQPTPTSLNVNVPAVPSDQVRGTRWAAMDAFGHFSVASQADDGTAIELDVRDRRAQAAPGSDTALCLDGYVTLTLLSPLAAVPAPDLDADVIGGTVTPHRRSGDTGG